jgi:hypothetical protein
MFYSHGRKVRDVDPVGVEEEDLVNAFSELTDRQNRILRYNL